MKHIIIDTIEELNEALYYQEVSNYAFRRLDFTAVMDRAAKVRFHDCMFFGCWLPADFQKKIQEENLIFPAVQSKYRFRSRLYTASDLYSAYKIGHPETFAETYDQKVFRWYKKAGMEVTADTDIKEALTRTLHDHSVTDCLNEFLADWKDSMVVGVMGGHKMSRTDNSYRQVVMISKELTERGYLMISGGGPGAMEATHLGAWMAGRSEAEVEDALCIMAEAPIYKDLMWIDTAFRVMEKYPQDKYISLGIPTWLYGHEPATPLATHIAKYFDNSIREDKILSVSKGGIIYTPGSAGTIQEIFQDATQNHYHTLGGSSPMVFMDKEFWTRDMPVYTLLDEMMKTGQYKNLLLSLTDTVEGAVIAICKYDKEGKAKAKE